MCPWFRLSGFSHFAAFLLAGLAAAGASASPKQDYYHALQSTGWVRVTGETGSNSGTCWLLDRRQRLAVTNAHVVGHKLDPKVQVVFPRYEDGHVVRERQAYNPTLDGIPAHVLWVDKKRDLALIELAEVPPEFRPLRLARHGARKGERFYALGGKTQHSHTSLWHFRSGKVLNVGYHRRKRAGDHFVGRFYHKRPRSRNSVQFAAFIAKPPSRPGDSGGPMINSRGELVGVTSSHSKSKKLGTYAVGIDVSEVRQFLKHVPPDRVVLARYKGSRHR